MAAAGRGWVTGCTAGTGLRGASPVSVAAATPPAGDVGERCDGAAEEQPEAEAEAEAEASQGRIEGRQVSPLPVTYTTDEVAGALKISVWTLRRLVKDGAAKPMRLSGSRTAEMRFDDKDIDDLKRALRNNPGGAIPAPTAARRRRRRAAS